MPDNEENKYAYLNKIACETEVHLQIVTPTKAVRLKTRLIGVYLTHFNLQVKTSENYR